MKKAVTPEHSKLLRYAIDQQKKAKNTLKLNKDHTFLQDYDNGFGGDHTVLMGKWSEKPGSVTLVVEMINAHKRKNPKLFTFPIHDGAIIQQDFLMPKQFILTLKRKA